MKTFISTLIVALFAGILMGPMAWAQQTSPASDRSPIFKVTVVQRALQAVNFRRHAGPTDIDVRGTVLMPKAEGMATVEVMSGYTKIDLTLKKLDPPTIFGTEFLTYVLWAITPDGKAVDLAEVIPNGSSKATLHVTSPYSTFGLLVTAEPYFSVPYPSDVIAMESAVRPDTVGRIEEVEVKTELLPRGQYTMNIRSSQLASASMKNQPTVSMEQYEATTALYEARNAVQIAKADGAEQAAAGTLAKASGYLDRAEAAYARKRYQEMIDSARQAVEAASDARTIAMRQKKSAGTQQN